MFPQLRLVRLLCSTGEILKVVGEVYEVEDGASHFM